MKIRYIASILAVLMAFLLIVTSIPVEAAGPNAQYLYIKQYFSTGPAWAGLKTGEVDVYDWSLETAQYEEWLADPNLRATIDIQLGKELGMFEFDLNSNATITGLGWATYAYPGKVNPMADAAFRRAIAKAVDKVSMASTDFAGTMEILDVPLAPPVHEVYINSAVVGAGYAYKYNLAQAAADLDAAGYTVGTDGYRKNAATGNSLYDDLTDGTNHGLIFYMRADKPDRLAAGRRYADALRALNIPIVQLEKPRTITSPEVMGQLAFHIYTGSWELDRDPDHLHDLYSNAFIGPWASNYLMYSGGAAIEANLDQVKYAQSRSAMITAAQTVQSAFWGAGGEMPNIILGHIVPMYTAYRKDKITGVVNEEGSGVKSWWTTSIGKKIANPFDTITFGLSSTVEQLNPVTSFWPYDWLVLDRIYDTLLGNDPYTLSDMPVGLAKSWRFETTATGNTRIVWTLRSGLKWHPDPERDYPTGAPLTPEDIKFSLNYHKDQQGWYYSSVMNIVNIQTRADNLTLGLWDVAVDLDVTAFLCFHWVGGVPIIPKYIWENVADAYAADPIDGTGMDGRSALIGSGPWTPKRLANGEIDPGFYGSEDHITLQANTNYYLSTTEMIAFLKEAFRRGRGDVDYSGYVDGLDLAKVGLRYNAATYQAVPQWRDDMYPEMIYSPPVWNPVSQPPYPPFDNSGTIISDTDAGSALIAFAATETHRENIATNGAFDPSEYMYRDADTSGNVTANDIRFTAVPPYAAGSTVVVDTDIGATLIAFVRTDTGKEKHTENIAVNGAYDPGEFIYRLKGQSSVSAGAVRLTPVGSYPAGSTVAKGDTDIGNPLIDFATNERHTENIAVNGAYDPGEFIYRDADSDFKVTNGDVRLTDVGAYSAGSAVVVDADFGFTLIAFAADEKHRENISANGVFDPGEFIYRDADYSGTVSGGDVRLTPVGSYSAGSTVVGAIDRNGKGFPWYYEDFNYDNKVYTEDFTIIAKNWHARFGGMSWP